MREELLERNECGSAASASTGTTTPTCLGASWSHAPSGRASDAVVERTVDLTFLVWLKLVRRMPSAKRWARKIWRSDMLVMVVVGEMSFWRFDKLAQYFGRLVGDDGDVDDMRTNGTWVEIQDYISLHCLQSKEGSLTPLPPHPRSRMVWNIRRNVSSDDDAVSGLPIVSPRSRMWLRCASRQFDERPGVPRSSAGGRLSRLR